MLLFLLFFTSSSLQCNTKRVLLLPSELLKRVVDVGFVYALLLMLLVFLRFCTCYCISSCHSFLFKFLLLFESLTQHVTIMTQSNVSSTFF